MKKQHKRKFRHGNGLNGKKRPNGNGTLEKRPNGWLARWYCIDELGKRIRISQLIRKSDEIPDIEAARNELNRLTLENSFSNRENSLLRIKNQLEGITAERKSYLDNLPSLKLDDVWDVFIKTRAGREQSDSTRYVYSCQIGKFIRWIGSEYPSITEMREITRPIARQFSEYLLAKHSANTHNKYITLFFQIWKAIQQKEIEESDGTVESTVNSSSKARLTCNPWDCIEKEMIVTHHRQALTMEELKRLFNGLSGEMKLLFGFGILGMRKMDAALMTWDKIQMKEGFIKFRPHKNERQMAAKNQWVYIPIFPEIYSLLSEIPIEKRHGYVMPTIAEKYLHSTSSFSNMITKVFKDAGFVTSSMGDKNRRLVDYNFHSLRHSMISIGASGEVNIPLTTLQAIAGHSSILTTQKNYLHISKETLKKQMSAFPKLIDV